MPFFSFNATPAALLAGLLLLPGQAALAIPPPDSPRLLNQALTSEAARASAEAILRQPPSPDVDGGQGGKTGPTALVPWAWAGLGLLGLFGAWRLEHGRRNAARRHLPAARRPLDATARTSLLDTHGVPRDIAGTAERLWPQQPRAALGLLYQALLLRLAEQRGIALTAADTEAQVLARIDALGDDALSEYSHRLSGDWQALAYGHRLPSATAQAALCNGWRQLFGEAGA
jgi:hypothetical protein